MVTNSMVGKLVTDGVRVGILRAVDPEWTDPASPVDDRRTAPTAFVWPEGGGCEWTANPSALCRV